MMRTKQLLRRPLLATIALLLALVSIAVLRTASLRVRAVPPGTDEDRLREVAVSIENAFRRGDPAFVVPFLSQTVKIHVAADSLGCRDAYYGASQLAVLLDRLFSLRTTESFTTLLPPGSARLGDPMIVPARWVSRDRLSAESEVRLAFGVTPEGPRFAIREIREMK